MNSSCTGGDVGGKEFGERLARFLTRDDCKMESIYLLATDLIGSRNVNTWIECVERNKSLSETEGGKTKGYWDGTTFPDATLSKEQEEALKEIVSKALDPIVRVKNLS